MNRYYSKTIRIVSAITLIAFVSTQVAFGYEGCVLSTQAQKSHIRSQQAATKGSAVGKSIANSLGAPEPDAAPAGGASRAGAASANMAGAGLERQAVVDAALREAELEQESRHARTRLGSA